MKEIIFKAITVVLVGVTIYLTYATVQQVVKNQAIDGCLNATSAKFRNDAKQDVTTPDGYWFDACMKQKGLKIVK